MLPANPSETWTVRLGKKPFILRVKKLQEAEWRTEYLFYFWVYRRLFLWKWVYLRKVLVCLAALNPLSKPPSFINTFHRVFVGLMTFCTFVLRAQVQGRQVLVLLYSAHHLKIPEANQVWGWGRRASVTRGFKILALGEVALKWEWAYTVTSGVSLKNNVPK